MPKIKISGIKRYEDVMLVNEICPSYVGLTFFEDRYRITANIASHLVFDLRPEIDTIGMFKNQTAGEIISLLSAGIIDVVELCGDESEAFIESLKLRAEAKIIKRFALKTPSDLLKINESHADYVSISLTDYLANTDMTKSIVKPLFLRGRGDVQEFAMVAKSADIYVADSSHLLDVSGFISQTQAENFCDAINSTI